MPDPSARPAASAALDPTTDPTTGPTTGPTIDLTIDPAVAARIAVVFCDVDGVLTDGRMTYGAASGTLGDADDFDRDAIHASPVDRDEWESKSFHVRDGMAAVLLRLAGLKVVLITGERTAMVRRRAAKLGLEGCIDGCDDKLTAASKWVAQHGLTLDQAAHIGDEVNDIALLRAVALSLAPSDCSPVVAGVVSHTLATPGGAGVLREAAYALLQARGELTTTVERYVAGERPKMAHATAS